jgi:hypothetical protein
MRNKRFFLLPLSAAILMASGCNNPFSSPPAKPKAPGPSGIHGTGDGPISEAEDRLDRKIYMRTDDPRTNDPGPHYSPRAELPEPPEAVKQEWAFKKLEKEYFEAKAKWGPNDTYTIGLQKQYKKQLAEREAVIRSLNAPR